MRGRCLSESRRLHRRLSRIYYHQAPCLYDKLRDPFSMTREPDFAPTASMNRSPIWCTNRRARPTVQPALPVRCRSSFSGSAVLAHHHRREVLRFAWCVRVAATWRGSSATSSPSLIWSLTNQQPNAVISVGGPRSCQNTDSDFVRGPDPGDKDGWGK